MKARARRKAQRPGEILEAAFDAFAERGFAATRMEDVAARAGVTKGAIYFYFETKERLFEEAVSHYSQAMLADAGAMLVSAEGGSAERLRAFLQYIYSRCANDRFGRALIGLMVSDGRNFPRLVERHRRDFFAPAMAMVSDLLAAGAARGDFRPEIVAHGAEIAIAPSVFLSLMRLIFGASLTLDEDAYVACHIDLLLHGLLTPQGRANLSSRKACGESRAPI
ncbi:TetR/AcrR family transcriptional regulator [Rhodoblastus sp.]|uniref:TetR/AcrR family transcriptional regulator n=1 Tax=Rhodoblastus sp. TaxID=1962975 RepID=UPI003F9A2E8C